MGRHSRAQLLRGRLLRRHGSEVEDAGVRAADEKVCVRLRVVDLARVAVVALLLASSAASSLS